VQFYADGPSAPLSPDGRLVYAALAEKIDRQMNKLNADEKMELRVQVARDLAAKEEREGPVVLTTDQRRAATAQAQDQEPKTERSASKGSVPTDVPRRRK
jgi:hypothetical protein